MNLTKAYVEKLPIPIKLQEGRTEQKRYYDSKLKGFGIRVTSGGTKAYFIEKLINRKLKRITIGHYPAVTTELARKEAQKMLGKIATGIDPLMEKQQAKIKRITVQDAFNDYTKIKKKLKSSTIEDYRKVLNQVIPDWLNIHLLDITSTMVCDRHAKHGETRSKARSNTAMRVLGAIFNFSKKYYESDSKQKIITNNPVDILTETEAWYDIPSRETYVKSADIAAWYKGVMSLTNEVLRDYILLVLFTGLRRNEASSLQWQYIDFNEKILTAIDTKNGLIHRLPMSTYLVKLLKQRQAKSQGEAFVFPGTGKTGHIAEPRKGVLRASNISKVNFTIHDLRRTFLTIADSLDISAYALKRLVNHKMTDDVTAGYIMKDINRLRKPMQQITNYLLKCIKQKPKTNKIKGK